ncbi:RluA family pseudouridine synthase [Marinilabiliaceae bacterium ANBcel2]|nr:RluA family pseudouridine synthase [Marinilabiliaceae bacterium ANBcel2]
MYNKSEKKGEELLNSTGDTGAAEEMYEHYKFTADPGQKPLRIDKFLSNRIENASRSKIQQAAEAGSLLANNIAVKANYKVKANDIITVVMSYPPREIEIIPENIPLNIIYEDDHLIIINKEPGMVVHPGYGNYKGTLVNALAWHFKDKPWFNSKDPRPGLVHRIDKNTSGLMVIAKTEEAKMNLALQFFEKTSTRTYQAITWGTLKEREGTITGNIGRSLKNRKIMTIFPDGELGKHAVTHYKVLEEFGYVSLVECRLETGRTHQIRAHFKHIGHPLFNDETYGGDQILKGTTFTKYRQFIQNCFNTIPRQALHAKTLGFVHPKTGEPVEFNSDLPQDFVKVLEKWRTYTASRKMDI